jgi:hypothetical protein
MNEILFFFRAVEGNAKKERRFSRDVPLNAAKGRAPLGTPIGIKLSGYKVQHSLERFLIPIKLKAIRHPNPVLPARVEQY